MDVLLIQPPGAIMALPPRDSAYGHSERFTPHADLLCLRAYIAQRTRHACHYVDTRFFGSLEKGLAQSVAAHPELRLAVIYATSTGIGQVASVADLLKRIAPQLPIAICGPHPSRFPQHARVPHVDFALCGDPEPILRSLIDNLDAGQRLRRVPGLLTLQSDSVEPAWLPDLKSLVPPDFEGVSWPGYRLPPPRQGAMAEVALARGHTRCAFDRAFGGSAEPQRVWPMDRMAVALQRARHAGIVEVFLTDPPGFWQGGRLAQWIAALDRERNTLPWSFQMVPQVITADLVQQLRLTVCRRIEFLFPTAEPALFERHELRASAAELRAGIANLQAAGIEVEARFWIGGPEATPGEAAAVYHLLRDLRFCPFSLHPYPLAFDAPLCQDVEAGQRPDLEDWMRWARDPWMAEKPTALWGGVDAVKRTAKVMDRIERSVNHSPRRRWLRLVDSLRSVRVIDSMENAAMEAIVRRNSSSPGA